MNSRQEQERRRQLEFEKQLQRQREVEQEREEQRRRAQEQREAARRCAMIVCKWHLYVASPIQAFKYFGTSNKIAITLRNC